MNEHTARLDGPPTGDGDDRFRVGAAKLFADGGVAIALDASVGGHPFRFGMLFGDLETRRGPLRRTTASASPCTRWATWASRR